MIVDVSLRLLYLIFDRLLHSAARRARRCRTASPSGSFGAVLADTGIEEDGGAPAGWYCSPRHRADPLTQILLLSRRLVR
jgi:hypothetical protein